MIRRLFAITVAFLGGVLAALVLMEVVLHALPAYRGTDGADPDAGWPAHHLIPNSNYTFSTGWDLEDVRHGHVNNMGYVSPFDYRLGTAGIMVIGDSYIADYMNQYADSLQGALPRFLARPATTLGFGTAGGSLPHDLGVAALVGQKFTPTWGVVVITRGNFIGGFNYSPGYYRWSSGSVPGIELVPERKLGRLAKFFRDLALVGYARGNLRADLGKLLEARSMAKTQSCQAESLTVHDAALLHYAAAAFPQQFKLPPSHVIMVFDGEREAIYAGEPLAATYRCPTRDLLATRLLAKEGAEQGMKVIDMDPVFRAHYAQTGEHFDYLPADGHWNGVAHVLAAREVASYINGDSAPTK
jgi:hypothetical protein